MKKVVLLIAPPVSRDEKNQSVCGTCTCEQHFRSKACNV